MQFIKTLVRLTVFLCPFVAAAQSTYLPQGDKQSVLLERLEIKAQTDSVLNLSKIKPFNRGKYVVNGVNSYLENYGEQSLSRTDQYNLRSIYLNNTEWLTDEERAMYASKKPVWKKLYTTPANFFETHVKDFDLIVNPVVQYVVSKEIDNDQTLFLNTRGINLRGRIANKIGFSAYITDNQERDPRYVQNWINERQAVPGEGFYKDFKAPGGVDYFDARGSITFNVTKYIDVAFGYDKNFIGNGYRSLYLSDFGSSNLFLRLNTRIWKFNYQNLFMELANADNLGNIDKLVGKKYAAMHHLDLNVTKWLNIGLFEGITFGRTNHFEFGYLNPVIFYRSIELQNGSIDNSVAGLDFKANIAKRFQVYGQLLLDEFKLSEIKAGNGWWANKYGLQLGAKYIDAFGVNNLDLQVEANQVRPFTYSHNDSIANYTHYNQPLAHPLMANFREIIGIVRYQPAPKWFIQAKAIYYRQGRDSTSSSNFGSNIFLPSVTRNGDYGYSIGAGWKTDVLYSSLLVSYEIRENLFIELFGTFSRTNAKTPPVIKESSKVISLGVRWNMHRREFDF